MAYRKAVPLSIRKKSLTGGVRHHKQRIDMETTRQNKISRLIEKELGDIFLKYAKTLGGVMLTVTKVNISPDLSIAHVNISIFPSEKQESVMEQIKKNDKNIRYELGNRVRHQLRIIPQLHFHIDDTLDYMQHIDELLKGASSKSTQEEGA